MVVKPILKCLLLLIISTVYKSVAVSIIKDPVIRSATPISNKTWENWNGAIDISPNAIFEPSTLQDLIDIVKLAKKNNKTIRCAAQGHTVSSLSVTDHYLVVVNNLNKAKVQKHSKYGWTVTAEAGMSLSELDQALRAHNPPLTLNSETVYNSFRVSGVIAVGAHGANPRSGLLGIIYSVTFRVQPMYNLIMNDNYVSINEWLNANNIKKLLNSSDGIELFYWPFNGFNQSDPNPFDTNKDLVWVKNWVRTDKPVSITQKQLEQLRKTQRQGMILQYQLLSSLLKNPEETPNITSSIWEDFISSGNKSLVLEAPDAFHYVPAEESVKLDLMEFGFKVDPDFSNVVTEFLFAIKTMYKFAKQGKFPLNYIIDLRIIKSTKALLSTTFDNDSEALYCQLDFETAYRTPSWEEFGKFMAKRYFDKYKAKPHWAKEWEFIPNVTSYLSNVLSDQIKQFEQIRAKYDPDKIFFDNKSLQEIFSKALGSKK
ncbi:FAD-binding domain-containing protein [Gigaspora margarita]|uniref:D-arabinono-1,4-lactone oxidase n=1 Tax=Gigaspora margarita TaxID=4874 RepID=A0A8H4AM11_GIGMA|nr:FAD-binding domain-containing protein [Gigaspora margarita]